MWSIEKQFFSLRSSTQLLRACEMPNLFVIAPQTAKFIFEGEKKIAYENRVTDDFFEHSSVKKLKNQHHKKGKK